jgi:hypothetical protein
MESRKPARGALLLALIEAVVPPLAFPQIQAAPLIDWRERAEASGARRAPPRLPSPPRLRDTAFGVLIDGPDRLKVRADSNLLPETSAGLLAPRGPQNPLAIQLRPLKTVKLA